jgi:hypothetical protein
MFCQLWLAVLLIHTVCCQSVTTLPEVLLINAPFRVTVDSLSISSVFVSPDNTCRSAMTGGTPTPLISKTAAFQVSFGNVRSQTVFLCDSAGPTPISPLVFQSLSFSPPYGIRNAIATVTFSNATPNNALVEIRELSDCSTQLPAASASVDSNKKISVVMTSSFFYFVCVSFVSPVTLQFFKLNVGQFVVTDPSFVDPTTVATNQAVTFELRGAAPPFTKMFIAQTADCTTPAQSTLTAGGSFGKTISTIISVPRGAYSFCVENPRNSGIFIPSGTLQVLQFGVLPPTIFTGKTTLFTPSLDTKSTDMVAISSTSSCEQPFIAGPSVMAGATWMINATGPYYSCVDYAGKFVLASTHAVVSPYLVTANRGMAVRGLSLTISVVAPGPVTVTLCQNSCALPLFTAITINNQALFQMAPGDFASDLTLLVCVQTVDGFYTYPALTLPIRRFIFSAGPFIAGRPGYIQFDNETGGASYGLSMHPSCAGFVFSGVVPFSLVDNSIQLATAEIHYLCIRTGTAYLALGTLRVFAVPSTSPSSTIARLPTTISFFSVPLSAPVTVGTSCLNVMTSTLSNSSSAAVVFSAETQSIWALCVGIPDSSDQFTMFQFGSLSVFSVSHSPTYHVVDVSGFFAVNTQQRSLLNGLSLMLSTASDCSTALVPSSPIVNMTSFVTPPVPGTHFVCIGSLSQQFVRIGLDNILQPITTTPDITPTLSGIPLQLKFSSGNYTPGFFFVSESASCSSPTKRGAVNGDGFSESMTLSTGSFYCCVTSDDGVTLLPAGTFFVGSFQSLRTSLANGLVNGLAASPALPNASLFLTTARDCSTQQYFTSETIALTAPPGNYTLCQGLRGGSSPSINEVSVLGGYVARFPSETRQFVPFNINLSGGDIAMRNTVEVYSVLAGENCWNGTVISRFQSTVPSEVAVTVTSGQYVSVRFCIASNDLQVIQSLGIVTPLPYMWPYTTVAGIPVVVTSAMLRSGFARFSTSSDCASGTSSIGTVSSFNSTLTLPFSTLGDQAFYCESVDGNIFTTRGVLILLRFDPSGGDNLTVGLQNRTVLPGRAILLSVPVSLGKRPYAVKDSCSGPVVDLSSGYDPQENEAAAFFICVLSPDETLLFTTPYKSLSVQNYAVFPKSIASGRADQQLTLTPSATQESFVSNHSQCNFSLASTLGLISGTAFVNVPATGLLFLCIGAVGSAVSVVSFASFDLPVVFNLSLPLINVPLCFAMSVSSGLFSVIPGVDKSFPLSAYFQTDNRSLFWATSAAECRQGVGHQIQNVTDPSSICLSVVQSPLVVICSVTPAGSYAVSSILSPKVISIEPTRFVADAVRSVRIINCENCTFALSSQPSCDDALTLVPSFQSGSNGDGVLSSKVVSPGPLLSEGNFTLCLLFGQSWFGVTSVEMFKPVSYGVSNSAVVQGVTSTVKLLQDLTTSRLLAGTYSSASCSDMLLSATWSFVDNMTITVRGDVPSPPSFYLCAICPVNDSIVSVSRFSVIGPFIQFPSSLIVCSPAILSLKLDIGSAVVSLYSAPCCSASLREDQVVRSSVLISSAPLVRSITLVPNDLERFAPLKTFNYCLWNDTLCLDLGSATVSGAVCLPPTPQPPPRTPTPSTNGSSLLNFLGGAAPNTSAANYTNLLILVIVFGSLFLCVIFACCLHRYLRSRQVVPADVADDDEGTITWKKSFDSLAPTMRTKRISVLHVPMDMTLDVCREPPIAMQQLEVEETKHREELMRVEQAVLDEIMRAMYKERHAVMGYSVALERTRIIETVNSLLGLECGEVQAQEDYDRRMLEEDEESNLLQLAELERASWRQVMDIEGKRLQQALERDPFWRTRRQQLREAHSRALLSTDQGYSPSRNISYSSAGGGSPTPYRTANTQRRDPRVETFLSPFS